MSWAQPAPHASIQPQAWYYSLADHAVKQRRSEVSRLPHLSVDDTLYMTGVYDSHMHDHSGLM